ncbi:ACP phosphodiesterase [Geomonas sp. Red32]|uniref:acyl carrier protein phosphodiesterase n=1 Tax=Geomonas sp. Red32 TaxID=2912856 RepID=UPI00202CF216|nr:ACP phosphodiesterase [Geomonas sp. Red32]MCM0081507.1 ACP phosphodiesterase [Geomonas sp. Red32]
MNYLFHLYLSGDDPDLLTGNFMGDFVKGHLDGRFPAAIQAGIQLHRAIDSFAHTDLHFNQSRLRIDTSFGLYRGILVDLFYDHFLTASWEHWSDEPLPRYLGRVRDIVEERRHLLPERLQQLIPIIFEDLIPSYLDTAGIGQALVRMSRRISRPNPLAGGERELVLNYAGLREDFEAFLPDATRFTLPRRHGA